MNLEQYNAAFAKAADGRTYEEIPDGQYNCRVKSVSLGESRNGNPMLKWQLVITDGTHAGRFLFRNNVLSGDTCVAWLKQDLQTCGLRLGSLTDLPGRMDELKAIGLAVTVKTKGGYHNVYLNRKLKEVQDYPF